MNFLQVVPPETKITVGCVRTILLLIEAKALRLGRNENNINMCNSSSLIMKNFRNGTDNAVRSSCSHFQVVPRIHFCSTSRERACATEGFLGNWGARELTFSEPRLRAASFLGHVVRVTIYMVSIVDLDHTFNCFITLPVSV